MSFSDNLSLRGGGKGPYNVCARPEGGLKCQVWIPTTRSCCCPTVARTVRKTFCRSCAMRRAVAESRTSACSRSPRTTSDSVESRPSMPATSASSPTYLRSLPGAGMTSPSGGEIATGTRLSPKASTSSPRPVPDVSSSCPPPPTPRTRGVVSTAKTSPRPRRPCVTSGG